MKILWWSAPPYSQTGYGVQCREFTKRLMALGHEVHVVSTVPDLTQPHLVFDGISVLPGGWQPWGQDAIGAWSHGIKADIVFSMVDLFPFLGGIGESIYGQWYPFVSIDSYPLSKRISTPLSKCTKPIAYSRFGKQMMKEAGLDPTYIPLGVNTEIFKPLPARSKAMLPNVKEDDYLVGMVAMNQGGRKAFGENFQAFAKFHERHLKSWLYVHANWASVTKESLDLRELARVLNIGDAVIFPDPWLLRYGFEQTKLAELYNAFDVLLAASNGEAFGVPIVEAQACGTPVIVSNHSAMKETGTLGVRVNGIPRWSLIGTWEITPSVTEIEGALEYTYKHKPDREKLVRFAAEYDFNSIVKKYLVPFLDSLMVSTP